MIKDRILQIAEYHAIPKEKFFRDLGVTSANFRGKAKETPINSAVIEKIFTSYPEISLEWLINGCGSMLKAQNDSVVQIANGAECQQLTATSKEWQKLYQDLQKTVEILQKTIESQQRTIETQQRFIETLQHTATAKK